LSSPLGTGGFVSSTASVSGSDVGDEEQKRARFLPDLGDGRAARNETAPARGLARVSGEDEDGRRRAQEANAILAAAIIPVPCRCGAAGDRGDTTGGLLPGMISPV